MLTRPLTQDAKRSTLPIAEITLLLTAIFWGTSYGIAKEALVYTSIMAFIILRFGLTSILLVPFYWREVMKSKTKDWRFALPTGAILLCIFLAETYGVFHTSASKAAFLISLCVLMTPFVEAALHRRLPNIRLVFFALLSLFGVYLLTQHHQSHGDLELNRGDLAILLAAFLRACMVVSTNLLLKGKTLSPLSTTFIQANVVTWGGLIIFLSSDLPVDQLMPTSVSFWLAIFYLVLFCTVFALFAQNYGVQHTGPSRVALLTGSEPAFGALFAFLWLGESFSLIQIIGAGLILLATLLATLRAK